VVSINNQTKEINCKIVYYGPGLGGKTTNLLVIHKKVPKSNKSEMVSLATESDRTLFFDYLPLELGKIKGYDTKFQLYTVPGQVYYNETRKLVLRGVDGIVFVADSQKSKLKETIESYKNLILNLKETGLFLNKIPHVIQYNKRDLQDVLSIEELEEKVNKLKVPYFEAVAVKSNGVFNTLKSISKVVINKYNRMSGIGVSSSKFKKKTSTINTTRKSPEIQTPRPKPTPSPAIPKVEGVDDNIQNYINTRKLKNPTVVTSPSEIKKKITESKPAASPAKPNQKNTHDKPKSDPFLEASDVDEFNYTPENPGYTGLSEELSDENSSFLDIKPDTGMSEGDLPPPRESKSDIDFDPYGDSSQNP